VKITNHKICIYVIFPLDFHRKFQISFPAQCVYNTNSIIKKKETEEREREEKREED
jgi:hypothetical protein